ncbi:hypothetical protein JD844_002703 [Phrynosoma platyrhinos]|uniref:Grh/CP2 DB domain-containing protein n=1 Tax=Phrynosoma platyrhinos TaxID=52577 RepID=A0ABQ7TCH6_PHRPL|nr:hypothetical protein JD844_002703 [Phrynosoma platyrhinos]
MAWVLKMDEVIESGLAHDFDASLSGIGQELGAGAYSMSDVLALPIFKQEDSNLPPDNDTKHPPFQYVMCAATSPAAPDFINMTQSWFAHTPLTEHLTNNSRIRVHTLKVTVSLRNALGQSYEIRLLDNRKMGDMPEISGKLVKSIIRVVFHDRRLQYTEHQQLEGWKWNRPGDRLLDLDIPMSVGVIDIKTNPSQLNAVEFLWDPGKRTSAFIQDGQSEIANFQANVGFHLDQKYIVSALNLHLVNMEPKGADRKQKTDREKMEKRTAHEKEKYQPSYDTTILTEMRLEPIFEDAVEHEQKKSSKRTLPADYGDSLAKRGSCSPWPDTPTTFVNSSPTPTPAFTSTPHSTYSVPDSNSSSPNHQGDGIPQASGVQLHPSATIQEAQQWLLKHRFSSYTRVFSNFSGADLLKLTREDLVQICGPADGIRLYNALKSRSVRPRLTIYVCQEQSRNAQLERQQDSGNGEGRNGAIFVYHAIYLEEMAASEVTRKLALVFNIPLHQIIQVYRQGPTGIHILVSDQMVQNFEDESCFLVTTIKEHIVICVETSSKEDSNQAWDLESKAVKTASSV